MHNVKKQSKKNQQNMYVCAHRPQKTHHACTNKTQYLHSRSRATLILIFLACQLALSIALASVANVVCVHGRQYRYLCNDMFAIREREFNKNERRNKKCSGMKNHGEMARET